jgi:hypothetical protein
MVAQYLPPRPNLGSTWGALNGFPEDGVDTDASQMLSRLPTPQEGVEPGRRLAVLRGIGTRGEEPPTGVRQPSRRYSHQTVPPPPPFTDSAELCHITPAQIYSVLGHASVANRRIIFDARQEGSNESNDGTWRRWVGYCKLVDHGSDPLLFMLSLVEHELISRAFLSLYRTSNWNPDGRPTGTRSRPMVASTLRQATSELASAFRVNFRESPVHVPGSPHLRPSIRALLRALDNRDPPPQRQKAITPKLLKAMFHLAGVGLPLTNDTTMSVTAELLWHSSIP